MLRGLTNLDEMKARLARQEGKSRISPNAVMILTALAFALLLSHFLAPL